MRILYCNKYNFRFSGTEAYLFETMEAIRARGHETALFSVADSRGETTRYDEYLVPKEPKSGWAGKARFAGQAIYSFVAREKLRGLLATFRPDVAHVRNIYHHLSPSILWELKAHGIPVIYHVNDFKLLCPAYNLVSRTGVICERCVGGKFRNAVVHDCHAAGRAAAAVLAVEAYLHRWMKTYEKCVDLVLAPSQFVRDKFVASGWNGAKIQVLPHFQNLPAKTVAHPSDGYILYFGRLSPEKGVHDVVAAMALLPGVQLVVAGDGPQRGELEAQVSSRGLKNVRFVGHVAGTALNDLIAGSQFTLFPSRAYETFGKSIVESYAHARAVVASDLGSRRELVEDGVTGLLYPAGNVQELAANIRFLCDRPLLAREIGLAGQRLVQERYSRQAHVFALTEIYAELARKAAALRASRTPSARIAFIGGRGVVGKYSGVETWYEEVGKRLAARGHEVTVYCRRHFTPDKPEHSGMRLVRVPTMRTKHLETFVHTLLSTLHACCSKADIVHYQTLGPALFSFIPRLFGKKAVVTVQGLDWQRKKWSWFARHVLKAGELASAHFPDETLTVSRELQTRFRACHGTEALYIPNETNLRSRPPVPHLSKFGLRPDSYALFLGRLSPEKNCDLLIESFENIPTEMKLVIAGGSSHSDKYISRLRQHQSDRIIFLDWLSGDALEDVLSHAAVFVLPSDIEGMSLALLDAMGAGVCVLASDIPENREAIGDAGFTFRRGDVQDLRHMLNFVISDANLRARVAEKARLRVRENYLWDEVALQVEKIYLKLTNHTPGKRLVSRTATAA